MSPSIAVKELPSKEAIIYNDYFITVLGKGFWIYSNKRAALDIDRQKGEILFPDGSICFIDENGELCVFNADLATYIQIDWELAGIVKIVGKFPTPKEVPIIL